MAGRILEVHAAAAVVVVDLAGPAARGIGPVLHAALADLAVDGVELVLGHQERVVLRADLLAVGHLGVVEADVVVEVTARKGPNSLRLGKPKSSVRKFADSFLSLAATMVWLNVIAHVLPVNQFRRLAISVKDEAMVDVKVLTGDGVSSCARPDSTTPRNCSPR